MKTSVIIPNFNYARFLPAAIDSVLNQTESVDEIIVVDDGSKDESRAVLEGYGDRINAVFQENAGQAAAISRGFAQANGDIIFLLDSDDVFFPDKIRLIKQVYAANKDAGWVNHTLLHLTADQAFMPDFYPRYDAVNIDKIDQRDPMRKGRLGYDAPATSGLSFRRSFIADLFPLPSAQSIYISDHYIKFYAAATGPGLHIREEVGGQIIHGDNLYTGKKANATKGRIFINTAYFLKQKAPQTSTFCNTLAVEGMFRSKMGGVSLETKPMEQRYLAELRPSVRLKMKLKVLAKYFLKRRQA